MKPELPHCESKITALLGELMEQVNDIHKKLEGKVDMSTVMDLEKKVDSSLGAAQNRVETKVDSIMSTLTKNATTVHECVEGTLKVQLLEDKEEEAERNKRKTSIIVHGVEESTNADPEQRIQDDSDALQSVLHEISCDAINVKQVIRLGKRQLEDDDDVKPRPIKMVLETEDSKVRVLRNAKNLKNKEGGLNIKI